MHCTTEEKTLQCNCKVVHLTPLCFVLCITMGTTNTSLVTGIHWVLSALQSTGIHWELQAVNWTVDIQDLNFKCTSALFCKPFFQSKVRFTTLLHWNIFSLSIQSIAGETSILGALAEQSFKTFCIGLCTALLEWYIERGRGHNHQLQQQQTIVLQSYLFALRPALYCNPNCYNEEGGSWALVSLYHWSNWV